jgi:hypothetical protein
MIFGRFLLRLVLVPLAAGVSVCVAVLAVILANWNRFATLLAEDPTAGDSLMMGLIVAGPAIVLIVSVSTVAMMLPFAAAILIAETFAIRSWMYYALTGGIFAWIGWVTMVELRKPYDFYGDPIIAVGAGIAAGFAYWVVAGWSAGFWKPVFVPVEHAPAAPV